MHTDTQKLILSEYDGSYRLYEDFVERCEVLARELLAVNGYRVHSVTSRVKERDRLEEKIGREGKVYGKLSDVTDVAGVRIITHFEDEVDNIGALIEREFSVNPAESIDKRKLLDPDRFGYLSLHYVCTLHPTRLGLAENRRYDGLPCEIQIRSILQHAWAEIEHDLGYKPDSTVPAPIRRRFSRLAGLLELADQEFKNIRDDLQAYKVRVPSEIESQPSEVEIDNVSIGAFLINNVLARDLDRRMADMVGVGIVEINSPIVLDRVAQQVRYAGLTSIDSLQNGLQANKDNVLRQWKERVSARPIRGSLGRGVAVGHLAQVIVARRGETALADFFRHFELRFPDSTPEGSAREVFATIRDCL